MSSHTRAGSLGIAASVALHLGLAVVLVRLPAPEVTGSELAFEVELRVAGHPSDLTPDAIGGRVARPRPATLVPGGPRSTQNIDALHTRAGSADVIELHGSIRRFDCLACGRVETLARVLLQLEERPAPACPECGSILKPGVVMFGEVLPEQAMARGERLCRETGLLLVLGSSLEVWPVATLPGRTVQAGGVLAIVNLDETPYDGDAELVVRERTAVVLEEVARILAHTPRRPEGTS